MNFPEELKYSQITPADWRDTVILRDVIKYIDIRLSIIPDEQIKNFEKDVIKKYKLQVSEQAKPIFKQIASKLICLLLCLKEWTLWLLTD